MELAMFPGQGSQRAGMAAHLLARYPDLTGPVFELADETAGFALTQLCVAGDKQDLTRTDVAQLAVFATSLATWSVLTAHGYRPAAVAGHSLGELTALTTAGVLTIPAAFALVRRRGELMARVAERTSGTMLAVVGLEAATVERLCADATVTGVAEVANLNDLRQTVVSGHREALTDLAPAFSSAGADKVVMLEVGAPFHCSLMVEIEDEFAAALDECAFTPPAFPVVSSVTGARLSTGEEAKALLRRQLAGPVRWTEVLRTAEESGWTRFTEIGPGRVLSGFARNTFPDYPVHSTGDERRIAAVIRSVETKGRTDMTKVDTLGAVRLAVAEAVGIDEAEAEPTATVLGDLGAESIDLLDILFRIERKVGVKISANEIAELLQGELTDEEFEGQDGVITEAGLAQLERVLPQIDRTALAGKLTADDVMTLFTVQNLADMAAARAALTGAN